MEFIVPPMTLFHNPAVLPSLLLLTTMSFLGAAMSEVTATDTLDPTDHFLEAQSKEVKPSGARFTPNEVVGYRILPDEHNWTVVLVRKYGPASKNAGQEYTSPLAYCRTLESAAQWILNRDARMQTELHGLMDAMRVAREEVKKAVYDLATRLASGELALPSKAPLTDKPLES
jgi:hypothetical protein